MLWFEQGPGRFEKERRRNRAYEIKIHILRQYKFKQIFFSLQFPPSLPPNVHCASAF